MLSPAHVMAALEAKREAFGRFERGQTEQRALYRQALEWYAQQSLETIEAALRPYARPGARPTRERQAGAPVVRPFGQRWENHEQARAWAREIIEGVTTLAVDGSQITPDPSFFVPVGAVQVGWFENPHAGDRPYVKDLRFEVLAPDELSEDTDDAQGFPDLQVNLRRFELECEVLAAFMQGHAQRERPPVCFFDGSLIISFAGQVRPELSRRYLRAILSVLEASEAARVPVVGFVDTSRARDFASALSRLRSLSARPPGDATLLAPLMGWGDRTELLRCAREDRLSEQLGAAAGYYERVLVTYLKTTASGPPARLDLPEWLLEADLVEWVLDVVRAECIVGAGYPYAIETADAVSVISLRDREQFYRVFQTFLDGMDIALRYSRKAYSKRGRR